MKRAHMEALWSSARFYLSLFTTLLTLSIGGIYASFKTGIQLGALGFLCVGVIQWINVILVIQGKKQLRVIYTNFLEVVATIGKASFALGFCGEGQAGEFLRASGVCQEDKSFISPRYVESLLGSRSTQDFIANGIAAKGSWYDSMSRTYGVFLVISLSLAVGLSCAGILLLVINRSF